MQKVFVVEDDESIRDMVIYALNAAGFDAHGFRDGDRLWGALDKGAPSMLLLDIMLPGEDGISILRKLKASHKHREIPIIMLTAKGGEYDRIKGLDLGADDYITKPFSVMEVISRIRAVLRRTAGEHNDTIQIGSVALDASKRTVIVKDELVSLTYKEFELLQYLMRNAGIVLTRDRLLEAVWGYDYDGESRTVDMHVRTLRQKLGEGCDIIKTVRNVGYKVED